MAIEVIPLATKTWRGPTCPTCGQPADSAGPSGYLCSRGHSWPRSDGRQVSVPERDNADEIKRHAAARMTTVRIIDPESGERREVAIKTGQPESRASLHTITARELLTKEWPEPPWVVPGLLPVGLTLLAGRPKVGKSWLALQLAGAVATGGVFLDAHVQPAPCLYLALEDSPRRLAERMKAQGWTATDAQADFITVGAAGDLLPLNGKHNGALALADAMRERGYKLIIIDTLSRALAGAAGSPGRASPSPRSSRPSRLRRGRGGRRRRGQ